MSSVPPLIEPVAAAESPPGGADADLPLLDSRTLFSEGKNEIGIRHNGRTYRLRCTRLGKLILTA